MGSVRTIVRSQRADGRGSVAARGRRPAGDDAGAAAAGAELATVTVLPVARRAADDAAGVSEESASPAGVGSRPVPAGRTVRAAAPRRPGGLRSAGSVPRPVACDRSYAPDLHGARLTVRGRVVVGAVWAVLLVAMAVMVAQPAEAPAPAETTTLVVRPGDTLWGLAGELAPGVDRRVTVDQITDLNGLRSAGEIRPGDVLVVPAAGPQNADAP